jgi:hypothetical protein
MQYVTAQGSQNKLPLLQQSATINKIALKSAVAQVYRFYQFFNPPYDSTARKIRITILV